MKALLMLAAACAALGAGIAHAGNGPRDVYTDGAKTSFDVYTDGASALGKRDVFTDGARVVDKRDAFTDGARVVDKRDAFTDGA